MKGNPCEDVTIAMIVDAQAPTVVGRELNRIDDGRDRAVERRRARVNVDLHETATLFAAAIVMGMAMIRGAGRCFVVIVAVVGVRMKMPAADHRQQLRLVAARRRFDMLMMPAATDERVQEQREGGEVGD
jgi:hypothetical protein